MTLVTLAKIFVTFRFSRSAIAKIIAMALDRKGYERHRTVKTNRLEHQYKYLSAREQWRKLRRMPPTRPRGSHSNNGILLRFIRDRTSAKLRGHFQPVGSLILYNECTFDKVAPITVEHHGTTHTSAHTLLYTRGA